MVEREGWKRDNMPEEGALASLSCKETSLIGSKATVIT